ncbi:MAG TPA: hypothetical protein GXX38_09065 [Clostridia bacterium]|jgi:hypothetical protein|nr:hypothetical protein [Clostridia bacterium]
MELLPETFCLISRYIYLEGLFLEGIVMFWNKGTIIVCTLISMLVIIVTSMLAFASISPSLPLSF